MKPVQIIILRAAISEVIFYQFLVVLLSYFQGGKAIIVFRVDLGAFLQKRFNYFIFFLPVSRFGVSLRVRAAASAE